jgi:hypothetical protein
VANRAVIVQHRLAAAPVVAVTPVIDQRLDLGERGALSPVLDCLRVRPAGLSMRRLRSPRSACGTARVKGVMASFVLTVSFSMMASIAFSLLMSVYRRASRPAALQSAYARIQSHSDALAMGSLP